MATILIVDDQPANRKFLMTLLRNGNHRLLQAGDGAEALGIAQAEHPDLIISDILMPTMDGYEFVRRIRCDPTIKNLPVIFFTAAYHEREAQALAQACGVAHVLSKPCPPALILQTINQSLGLSPLPPPVVKDDTFDQAHLQLLTDKLANKVGELEVVTGKMTRLVEVSQQLALETDPTRLVERYCEAARDIIGARYVAIGMLAQEGPTFQPFLLYGGEAGQIPAPRMDVELFQRIFRERRTFREDNPDEGLLGAGLPLAHPRPGSFLGVPIISVGELYGILYALGKLGEKSFSDEDERLASSLAAQLGSAYRNVLQYDQLKQTNALLQQEIARRQRVEEELRGSAALLHTLSRRLMDAQESERRCIARELHDEIGQALSALRLNLHLLQRPRPDEEKATWIADSIDLVEQTLQQVRDLSLDLRPSILDDLGLVAALEWQLNRLAVRAGFRAQLNVAGLPSRLPAELETTCFRVIQEALTNVVRHAQARQVSVTVSCAEQDLVLTVWDDGVGFDVQGAAERARSGASMGLLSMQERTLLTGGELSVQSTLGQGTEIRVRLPWTDSPTAAGHHPESP